MISTKVVELSVIAVLGMLIAMMIGGDNDDHDVAIIVLTLLLMDVVDHDDSDNAYGGKIDDYNADE